MPDIVRSIIYRTLFKENIKVVNICHCYFSYYEHKKSKLSTTIIVIICYMQLISHTIRDGNKAQHLVANV